MGHDLYGISLEPMENSHFVKGAISKFFQEELILDIRKRNDVVTFVKRVSPDVVVHLAAQPLVSEGYLNPFETFSVNVEGTLNTLEGIVNCDSIKTALIVTTDKVYRNTEGRRPFKEEDCLGGKDPYSASKSMADTLVQSVSQLFPQKRILIARAGNVVGGGDYAKDRLIPDLVKAANTKSVAEIRNPSAVRPWQHVLDCLQGYIRLIDLSLKSSHPLDYAWNFGPEPSGYKSVDELITEFTVAFGQELETRFTGSKFDESAFLTLDSTKAKSNLGWSNKLNFSETIQWTTRWYQQVMSGSDPLMVSEQQIQDFVSHE